MKPVINTLLATTLLCAAHLYAEEIVTSEVELKLWADVSSTGNIWTIVPHLRHPAGQQLRYEILASKKGRSGQSLTRQSGQVPSTDQGDFALATLSLGIPPDENCEVDVRVFDQNRQVADLKLTLPR